MPPQTEVIRRLRTEYGRRARAHPARRPLRSPVGIGERVAAASSRSWRTFNPSSVTLHLLRGFPSRTQRNDYVRDRRPCRQYGYRYTGSSPTALLVAAQTSRLPRVPGHHGIRCRRSPIPSSTRRQAGASVGAALAPHREGRCRGRVDRIAQASSLSRTDPSALANVSIHPHQVPPCGDRRVVGRGTGVYVGLIGNDDLQVLRF